MTPIKPTITFRLPPDVLEWIHRKAEEQSITVSDFVRDILLKEMREQGETVEVSMDPAELSLLKNIMEMKAQGLSNTRMALELNKKGILTMRKSEWYPQTVINAVQKYEAYMRAQEEQ